MLMPLPGDVSVLRVLLAEALTSSISENILVNVLETSEVLFKRLLGSLIVSSAEALTLSMSEQTKVNVIENAVVPFKRYAGSLTIATT